jgi:drug/metabolite transporter (DMT)-like permease
MTDHSVEDPGKPHREKMQTSADEAQKNSEEKRRRSLEVSAGFYEKLSALDAGSIAVAVSVGIALLGKSGVGSIHSHLTWLAWIAGLLWLSLVCSIGHNCYFVKISRLEATQTENFSNYLALIAAGMGPQKTLRR